MVEDRKHGKISLQASFDVNLTNDQRHYSHLYNVRWWNSSNSEYLLIRT